MNEEFYKFTIYGNHQDISGNPIPYFRQTQASSRFNKFAKRYHAWKDFVRFNLERKYGKYTPYGYIPTEKGKKIYILCSMTFKDKRHADPENIGKGIADAIFKDDKYVTNCNDYKYGDSGSVTVYVSRVQPPDWLTFLNNINIY